MFISFFIYKQLSFFSAKKEYSDLTSVIVLSKKNALSESNIALYALFRERIYLSSIFSIGTECPPLLIRPRTAALVNPVSHKLRKSKVAGFQLGHPLAKTNFRHSRGVFAALQILHNVVGSRCLLVERLLGDGTFDYFFEG